MTARRAPLLRWILVASQAATTAITWPTWQARDPASSAPMLPLDFLAGLPPIDAGWAVLASLVVVLVRPRLGAWLHGVVLVVAMALDRMRLQPQFLSIALLVFGTLGTRGSRAVGLAHLAALWIWGGAHKLLSPMYRESAGETVALFFPEFPVLLAAAIPWLVAAFEGALGLSLLSSSTRRFAQIGGACFHVAVLTVLSPLVLDWNVAVWPWNAALASAAWLLVGEWREPVGATWRASPRLANAVVGLQLVLPAGFQLLLIPAPLAWAVYSMSEPRGSIFTEQGAMLPLDPDPSLRVPGFPTEGALIAAFRIRAAPSDILVVRDGRELARWLHRDRRVHRLPE